jgi:mannose-6-phosphate isomerase-like protein (cupin superfamily)
MRILTSKRQGAQSYDRYFIAWQYFIEVRSIQKRSYLCRPISLLTNLKLSYKKNTTIITITITTTIITTTASSKMKIININFAFITFAVLAASSSANETSSKSDENNELCWTGDEDPLTDADLPFFNSLISIDCKDEDDTADKQCGRGVYGKDGDSYLNWVFGTEHGDYNWLAMDKVGKSQYAPDGLIFAPVKLGKPGSLRDAHWHPNTSEILFITSGKARVTVTGLPKIDVSGQTSYRGVGLTNKNLRGAAAASVEGEERISDTILLGPGDAVIFPVGYHHYFEGVDEEDPLMGIAIFDTPDLNSFDTPQVLKKLPSKMLNKVLSLKEGTAEGFYKGPRRVISDPNPSWSPDSLSDATNTSVFKVSSIDKDLVPALRQDINGYSATKVVNAQTNTVLDKAGFSIAYTEIAPGASIEPYWMDDADEVLFVIEGDSIEVVRSGNNSKYDSCLDSFEIKEGFFALNEIGSTWTLTNNGSETAKVLHIFNNNVPTKTILFDAFDAPPKDVVKSTLYEY